MSGYFATGEILQVIHSEMDESAYGTDLIPLTGGLAEETTQLITSGAVVS
ncbi:MAG: hypothetical protein Q4B28_02780 [bacterium]|nr:hypothetical protein [bacterium]